jgi:hypothetical protein
MNDLISTLNTKEKLLLLLGTSSCNICDQLDKKIKTQIF